MNWVQTWKMAFASIFSNKMRSFLTMLGIIIGVLAVTLLVSVVQGATGQVTSQIASMGSNLLMVSVTDTRANLYISMDDLQALEGTDGVALTAPLVTTNAEVAGDGESQTATVQGVTPHLYHHGFAGTKRTLAWPDRYRSSYGGGFDRYRFGGRTV